MKNFDYLENLHEAVLLAYAKLQQEHTDDNAYAWYCARYEFENAICEVELTEEEREIASAWFDEIRRIKL